MHIKNTLIRELQKEIKQNLGQKLEQVRVPCMNYLKENALKIFKEKITEVYKINSDRIQVVDLPLFLKAVKIRDIDNWSFGVSIDESLINFQTKSGEPIYQYSNNGLYPNSEGEEVHNLKQYWHSPINGISEPEWYGREFVRSVTQLINKDFINFVKLKISKL